MMEKEHIIVLGAGPAGIGAGLGLGKHGLVLEGASEPGGLCRTIHLNGAVFDLGGHSFHTPHPEVRRLVCGALDMYTQPRQARCYTHGRFIRYPFQTHFGEVPEAALVKECAEGLKAADDGAGAANFEHYLDRRFGSGIARHFLLPYNRKLWGANLCRLAADWAGERVAAPAGRQESFSENGGQRKPLREETLVSYPAKGGFAAVMAALARKLPRLVLGKKVVWIDPIRKELGTNEGQIYRWRHLISTLAVPKLLALMPKVPEALIRLGTSLEALPMALALVVIGHPVDTPLQRVYCAGPEIPAHKVVLNHNSSPYLRSLPHHGILAEVALPPSRLVEEGRLKAEVIRGLCTLGLIQSPKEVRTVRVIRIPRAYPVPTLGRDNAMRVLRSWLQERGIFLAGRFGEWAYINSDEALHRGLMLGNQLLNLN